MTFLLSNNVYDNDKTVSGLIFSYNEDGPDIFEGTVYVKSGIICDIVEHPVSSSNWILPRFVNAHTHIGDSILKDPPLGVLSPSGNTVYKDLDSLVKPPFGLKHKVLSKTDPSSLIFSMTNSIRHMHSNGIGFFADFRENGNFGIDLLNDSYADSNVDIDYFVLGRPDLIPNSTFSKSEMSKLEMSEYIDSFLKIITHSDGVGMSGSNDIYFPYLQEVSSISKSKDKTFAIHAGEKDSSDIENSISLNPDILIHMTHADSNAISKISDLNIPVVVCPGSNLVTGVGKAPISDFLDKEILVSVGTDNIMLNSPDMFEEMRILSKLFNLPDDIIFKMCTASGAKTFNSYRGGTIEVGKKADLMILNGKSLNLSNVYNPLSGFVRRAGPEDIIGIL
ncbi:MAG: amidohydrolase family protein [Methanosarcinaceae archaeon]|nr:amidohydrolase family protein [Methanosarcinaceae archaeon]